MDSGDQTGFTIIEVILFLAISAMLLMIAFAFTGSTLRNMRFSDSTKSLQSFFQQQYTRVQTNSVALNSPSGRVPTCTSGGGITSVDGTANTGASTTCVLLGSVLDLNNETITVSPVLGYAGNATTALRASNPQIWAEASETYALQWQASIRTAGTAGSGRAVTIGQPVNGQRYRDVNRLMFLKDTLSEKINFYAVDRNQSVVSWLNSTDATDATNTIRNVPTLVCIQSNDGADMRGAIQFSGNGKQQGISIDAITSSVVPGSQQFFAGAVTGFGGVACG